MRVSEAFLLILGALCIPAYRLNVPRVLLPYHPTIPATFELRVIQPAGGCFQWRSTRPSVVSVSSQGVRAGECSDKAEVRATAKSASGELSAVIFAEDSVSGTTLSCGVSVDLIADVRIDTTTKVLYVDAAPVGISVQALNKEGDLFSTLSEIPVEWELTHDRGDRPLRIIPFEQSAYEAPPEVAALEKLKKKGYVVLVEGIVTGSATLTARFADQSLKHIKEHSLELAVVANLLLLPSQDLYVPVHSVVPFEVMIVKQHSTELVSMPSSLYYLHMDSTKVGTLDKASSSVEALARGSTVVHLLSNNVDLKARTGVRPPSTVVNVVDPETLQWSVSGDNWLLQTGTQYKLHVTMLDPHGNTMFISDNLRFKSIISEDLFTIHEASKNQSYFVVSPKKKAKTLITSKFISVIDKSGHERRQSGRISGEQSVEIVDPVTVEPKTVVLPYLPRTRTTYSPKAYGGSGLYDWSVSDTNICGIDAASGELTVVTLGETRVTAADRRNLGHTDHAQVFVVELYSLSFGTTRKEAQVGNDLVLNVQLLGVGANGEPVHITDCRAVQWTVQVADNNIFKHNGERVSILPTEGTGCATVSLRALATGDTTVTVSTNKFEASIEIAAFPPLQLSLDDVALTLGSSLPLSFKGGPRPWLLDPAYHFRKAVSTDETLSVSINDETALLECGTKEAMAVGSFTELKNNMKKVCPIRRLDQPCWDMVPSQSSTYIACLCLDSLKQTLSAQSVSVSVGNGQTSSLPLPVVVAAELRMCCSMLTRLAFAPHTKILSNCNTNARVILSTSSVKLDLIGHGRCGGRDRVLDSINGLKPHWSSSMQKLSKIVSSGVSAEVVGHGKIGVSTITAEVSKQGSMKASVKALVDVKMVERPVPEPENLVLWNEVVATSNVRVHGGSGKFTVADLKGAPFTAVAQEEIVIVTPRAQGAGSLRIVDACMEDTYVDVPVKVADIHALSVTSNPFVEVGTEVEVWVEAVDAAGASFSRIHGALANAKLALTNGHLDILKQEGTRYILRAVSVGTVSLSASAKSSTGRMLTSQTKVVQVFAPISFWPKLVTLVPESTFQLEVLGGPRPTPAMDFSLNNSRVATIESNALITSSDLGYTSVTGTVGIGAGHVSKDTVVVRVVSLAGIRVVASSRNAVRGGRLWVRVDGLDESETPFAFGGALYPFTVTWSISHPSVLSIVHPLGTTVSESNDNRFGIWVDANGVGSATVKVHLEASPNANKHFARSNKYFEQTVDIRVDERLELRNPVEDLGTVRISPNSHIQLKTSWSSGVSYSVFGGGQSTALVSLTSSGLLKAMGAEGDAALMIRRTDSVTNETGQIPVRISGVRSLDLYSTTLLETVGDSKLLYLPVGAVIDIKKFKHTKTMFVFYVDFRDAMGRRLHAASNQVSYRPHRFDLTEIVPSDLNRTLSITLKSPGETVLQVWDSSNPSMSVFLRLSAATALSPVSSAVVSDVICFSSPIGGAASGYIWSSTDGVLKWLDADLGVALALKPGNTHVSARMPGFNLHSKLTVKSVSRISMGSGSLSRAVSNAQDMEFVYPVTTGNDSGTTIGCSVDQLAAVHGIDAPFSCAINTVKAAKNAIDVNRLVAVQPEYLQDGYACVVRRIEGAVVALPFIEATATEIEVKAVWTADAVAQNQHAPAASAKATFHLAMNVFEKEISLSNADDRSVQTIVSIAVAPYQTRHVSAKGCDGDIVTVSQVSNPNPQNSAANKFFLVKLNVKNVAIWHDDSGCELTVRNDLTRQVVKIPVRVKLLGQAAKHVYSAIDSAGFIDFVLILLQHYSWLIPSLMYTCLAGIFCLAVYTLIYRRMFEKKGSFADESHLMNSGLSRSLRDNSGVSSPRSGNSSINNSAVFRDSMISPPGAPRFTGSSASRRIGSSGDHLWSTGKTSTPM